MICHISNVLFADTFQEEESGFSFTFDGNLGSLTEDKGVKEMEEAKVLTTQVVVIQSPTSPATDELGQKIANVKNVWENFPRSVMFDHRLVNCYPSQRHRKLYYVDHADLFTGMNINKQHVFVLACLEVQDSCLTARLRYQSVLLT